MTFPSFFRLRWAPTLLVVFLALVVVGETRYLLHHRHAEEATRQCEGVTLVVNDSTQATCARLTAEHTEFLALKDAAKRLNGTLVAGVKVRIKPETLYVRERAVPTVTAPDSMRRAEVTDTTKGYALHIVSVAPPTGPLRMSWDLTTPEFKPEVGFIQRPDGYYAVVSAPDGTTVTTEKAFFTPPHERALSLHAGASLVSTLLAPALPTDVNGTVYGAVQYRVSPSVTAELQAGLSHAPFLGVRIDKQFW